MRKSLLAGALVAAYAAMPNAALAAGTDPLLSGVRLGSLARVVTPAQAGLVTGDSARIAVRLRPGVRSFRAWLGTREITRSFSSTGRERVALLRAGRGAALRLGVNRLYVRVRDGRGHRDFDYVRFIRARRQPSLMRLRPIRARARGGPVQVNLRLRGKQVRLRARLNGRPVRSLSAGRVRRLRLDGDAGLRFGRNTIRFVAIDQGGAYAVERRTVRVGRGRPIPAAGRDRQVQADDVVRFDARRSRAARKSHVLAYAWRIVARPKGSKARLRAARSARPTLRPDRAGTYRVRLLVTERRGMSASDVVRITAGPNIPPIGVPITVLMDPYGDLRLGSPLNTLYTARGPGVQLFVFDRSDLTFRNSLSHAYTPDVAGMQALAQDVQGLSTGELAIITAAPGQSSSFQVQDPSAVSYLNVALASIGAPSPIQGAVANPPPQGFSAIGVPGMPCCEAPINPGLTPAGTDGKLLTNGALSGYLQLDNTSNYTFVSSDYVPFDTVAAGTTDTQAVMTIGGTTYTSDPLAAGETSGFFLLILDAGSLAPLVTQTQPVSVDATLDPSVALNGINALATELANVRGDPSKLVVLQSIGQVNRGDAPSLQGAWNNLATMQSEIGGDGLYLDNLDPAAGVRSYAFVGPVPPSVGADSEWSATASAVSTETGGQLRGLLGRNPLSQYYPKFNSTLPDAEAGLPAVIYQAPTPWPGRATAAARQAMTCIAAALKISAPIEGNYTNDSYNFAGLAADLDDIAFTSLPDVAACESGFAEVDFDAAKSQLETELSYVSTVWQFVGNLQKPLLADATSVTANLTDITQAINNTISPPNSTAGGAPLELLSGFLYLGSAIPDVGEAVSLSAETIGLAGEVTDLQNGSNELESDFTAQADSLGDTLAGRFEDAYEQMDVIGSMLVSDWGKLQATFQNVGGDWAWTDQTTSDAADAFTGAAQRLVYEALFPLEYTLYRFGDQHVSEAGDYWCFGVPITVGNFYPFAAEPEGGDAMIVGAGPVTDVWAFGKIDQDFLQQNATYRDPNGTPPQSLWNSMFAIPVSSRVNAPPIPNQGRFMLDVYGGPQHTITRDDSDECLVDGSLPPGAGR